jgi:hypothetical protein
VSRSLTQSDPDSASASKRLQNARYDQFAVNHEMKTSNGKINISWWCLKAPQTVHSSSPRVTGVQVWTLPHVDPTDLGRAPHRNRLFCVTTRRRESCTHQLMGESRQSTSSSQRSTTPQKLECSAARQVKPVCTVTWSYSTRSQPMLVELGTRVREDRGIYTQDGAPS